MKENIKITAFFLLMIIGIGFLIWGNHIMMHYENFKEIWKAARHAALPQFIIGIISMIIGYILVYRYSK